MSIESYENLLKRTRERAKYKDSKVVDFVERTITLSAIDMLNNNSRYHKSCYSDFANSSKLKRAQKRYNESFAKENPSLVKAKVGRPSTTPVGKTVTEETLTTRSKSEPYDKSNCIICQKPGGILHLVQTKNTGKLMLEVAEKSTDKSFYRRLNTICSASDAIANDVLYHNPCWSGVKQKVLYQHKDIESYSRTLSDIEFTHFIESTVFSSNNILDMNSANDIYKDISKENGVPLICEDNKKYLKTLIQENVPRCIFVKNKQRNKPDQILSDSTQTEAVYNLNDEKASENDLKAMWSVA